MDETNLTPDDERQLRDALAGAPDDIKQHFCRCWPSVKSFLGWLAQRPLPAKVKAAIELVVRLGDVAFETLGCAKGQASAG